MAGLQGCFQKTIKEVIKIKKIYIAIGLGYGDEGKGSVVDYLVRKHNAHTVVRFNGGSQPAHTVVSPDGIVHVFSQFGSGTLVPGVETFLSRFMLIDPLAIEKESEVLKEKGVTDCLERLTIDRDCMVITPFHKIINRMIEVSRGDAKHSSCGMGVGQAMMDGLKFKDRVLFAGDLFDKPIMTKKLYFLWKLKLDLAKQIVDEQPSNEVLRAYLSKLNRSDYVELLVEAYHEFAVNSKVCIRDRHHLKEVLAKEGCVVFEGAQGILLDSDRGFWPYVTPTCTTFENAERLVFQSGYSGSVTKVGVLRAYSTRHGNGPFVTEDNELTKQLPDPYNKVHDWQGDFRIGWFDIIATRYALNLTGDIDYIVLTNLDRLCSVDGIRICKSYEHFGLSSSLDKFFELSERKDDYVTINNILIPKHPTREHQSQLTKLLSECKPIYHDFVEGGMKKGQKFMVQEYVQFLEKELGVSIPIVSVGPRATEKIQIKQL